MSRRAADLPEMVRVRDTAPPETAVLTLEQVAAWLQVGCDTVLSLGVPAIPLSERNLRYSVRQVLRWLEDRAEKVA